MSGRFARAGESTAFRRVLQPFLTHPIDTLELPEDVTPKVEAQRRTVPGTKCVVLNLLALDRLITSETSCPCSKIYADCFVRVRGSRPFSIRRRMKSRRAASRI
jgi:hypothetical protein